MTQHTQIYLSDSNIVPIPHVQSQKIRSASRVWM